MRSFPNLVSDSALVQDTILHLRRLGGRASAAHIAETVLDLPALEPPLAAALVAEMIKDDWRLRIAEGTFEVELACADDDCRALDQTDYVVFDVETTGPKTPPCRVMEIGAYRVSRGRIVAEFQTLVNPQAVIPPFIRQLTGISDEMVRAAPTFSEVAADWLSFADSAVLVAHNAVFDVRFINHELSLLFPGRRMFNPHLCTVSLARRVMPQLASHRLNALAEHFSVEIRNRHRAADDARATAEVFLRLLEALHTNGVRDLAAARTFNLRGRKAEAKH